jgi:hypothetical protein
VDNLARLPVSDSPGSPVVVDWDESWWVRTGDF